MKTFLTFLIINVVGLEMISQSNCDSSFLNDTMSTFNVEKTVEGRYLETTLKKGTVIRFFRTNQEKYYLRFLVTENFYFDKTDVLETVSGHKSYHAYDVKQHKVNKNTGLFILEIPKNYVAQLKDHGITALNFAHSETQFTRSDNKQIKEISTCFYNSIINKNK